MNTPTRLIAGAVFSLLVLAGTAIHTQAVTFSIDAGSGTVIGGGIANEDDLLNPGAVPAILFPGSAPPVGGSGIEVNAFSYGRLGPIGGTAIFSVAPGSVGLPGTAVDGEVTGFGGMPGLGDESADIYLSAFGGFNTQLWDGDGVVAFPPTPGAPSPPLGLIEPIFAPGDNLDAVDARFFPGPTSPFGGSIFWSVDPATAAGPYGGVSSADIFAAIPAGVGYAAPPPALYVGFGPLGLAFGDDIDAMVYFEDGILGPSPGDAVVFSLAAGSPTLGFLGATPADLLITGPGFAPGLFAPAAALGLAGAVDELNALDIIPEPSRALLLALGLAGVLFRRKR